MKKIENKGVIIQFTPSNTLQIQVRSSQEAGEEQLRIIEIMLLDGINYALTYDLDVPAEAAAFAIDEVTIGNLLT